LGSSEAMTHNIRRRIARLPQRFIRCAPDVTRREQVLEDCFAHGRKRLSHAEALAIRRRGAA